jgi:ketosteroid isomerase-like protein
MSEASATPDLVELGRRSNEAANRREFGALMSFFAGDAVWDMSPMGLGVFAGSAAVRGFVEDWIGAYEEYELTDEEWVDLGGGVTFAVLLQRGRPRGSSGEVTRRFGLVSVWDEGLTVLVRNYPNIDEARADAERLAEERG